MTHFELFNSKKKLKFKIQLIFREKNMGSTGMIEEVLLDKKMLISDFFDVLRLNISFLVKQVKVQRSKVKGQGQRSRSKVKQTANCSISG